MRALPHGVWDFTEDEWAAIDLGIIKVYLKTRTILPAHWQTSGKTRRLDPAGELRSWAYEYAATHPDDIHDREPWQITHHIATRLQQYVSRQIKGTKEIPSGIRARFERHAASATQPSRTLRPRSYPATYHLDATPGDPASLVNWVCLVLYGRFIPADEIQFIVKGYRRGEPIYSTDEEMRALHTRKPTRFEWWNECINENDRAQYRQLIAQAFADGICKRECCVNHRQGSADISAQLCDI